MQINKTNKDFVLVEGDNSKVGLVFSADAKLAEVDLKLGPVFVEGSDVVSNPGEYEYGDASVTILETKEIFNDQGDIFKVSIDGVSIAYVHDYQAISNDLLDIFGAVDVLTVMEGQKVDAKVISSLDPRYVVYIGNDEAAANQALQTNVQKVDKLKLKHSDVTTADYEPQYLFIAG